MTPKLKKTSNIITRGAVVEACGGAIAMVLTVLSLLHITSTSIVSLATTVLGIGLLLQGAAVGFKYSELEKLVDERKFQNYNPGIGLSFEILVGGIVIALGIMAMGFAPISVLVPAASISLGVAIVMSSRILVKINDFKVFISESGAPVDNFARETIDAAFGIQIVIGLAAIALGILSLAGISAPLLTTIAILCLGFSIMLNGLAISGRLSGIYG